MREIIFKAKRKDWRTLPEENQWVEGFYLKRFDFNGSEQYFIFWSKSYTVWEYAEIDPETLCQYTGITDKNGQKIWENDIVEIAGEDGYFRCKWDEYTARFVLNGYELIVDFDNCYGYECEVVGNVFDDKDLLEVEE